MSVQPILSSVQVFAEDALPDELASTKRSLITAMVMGAWVNAHAQCGTFDLAQRDFDYVRNMYANCARIVGTEGGMVGPILAALFDQGMLPEIMKPVFKPD